MFSMKKKLGITLLVILLCSFISSSVFAVDFKNYKFTKASFTSTSNAIGRTSTGQNYMTIAVNPAKSSSLTVPLAKQGTYRVSVFQASNPQGIVAYGEWRDKSGSQRFHIVGDIGRTYKAMGQAKVVDVTWTVTGTQKWS